MIATTHKNSGIYAISLSTGKRNWHRLGYRFDWLLKLFEYLPCDNEGDGPIGMIDGQVLTKYGRLLDRETGHVLSLCKIEYHPGPAGGFLTVDGRPIPKSNCGVRAIAGQSTELGTIDGLLGTMGLETSGRGCCCLSSGNYHFIIACAPNSEHFGTRHSRLYMPAKPMDVPHYFLIVDESGNSVVYQESLESYYLAAIAWFDDNILALTLQTRMQWNWGYRRNLRVYDVSQLLNRRPDTL